MHTALSGTVEKKGGLGKKLGVGAVWKEVYVHYPLYHLLLLLTIIPLKGRGVVYCTVSNLKQLASLTF